MARRQSPEQRDAAAHVRDESAARRDAEWPVGALDHAAMDRLQAADDRAHARDDRLRAAEDREGLALGMERRTVIGQAQGLLMARLAISPEDAFELLVTQSQRANVKLYEVAADLVADHLRSIRTSG